MLSSSNEVKMRNIDLEMPVHYENITDWASDLLDHMAQAPVYLTRTKTKNLCREMFGSAVLRNLPRGKGRRIFSVPNSNDLLVLDYAQPAPRFEPSWVKARVHRGAFRTTLRPGLRLELLVASWF